MRNVFDLYWSFRSPYCYLAGPRLLHLTQQFDVSCRVRPVDPHALRMPELLAARPDGWLDYFKTDIVRTAAFLDMPIAWPRPDPVITDALGKSAAQQPLVRRLNHLAIAAEEAGRGLNFIVELSGRMWSTSTSDWTTHSTLEEATSRAGLSLARLEEALAAHGTRFDQVVEDNQLAERAAGHWGVPLMVFENEPFFGQDRIDQLAWRFRSRGLAKGC